MLWADSLEKTLMLGKTEGRRRRGWQRMRRLDGIADSMGVNLGKLGEMVRDRETWHAAVHGVTESDMTQRLNWTELMSFKIFPVLWPPDAKNWLIWKDPNARKDWRLEEKGTTEEDEMVGWHHNSMDMSLNKLWEIAKDRKVCCATDHWVTKSQTWLRNWNTK